MSYENLLFEVEDGLAKITINRPKVLNALNAATLGELEHALERAEEDEAVRAVLLSGSGEKSFVAGADISELEKLDALGAKTVGARGQAVMDRIASLGKPVAAAINGFALGGGLELAMACTIRTASENAKVGLPEVSLGVIPGYGGTQRLPRLVGLGRALELILTGDMIDAREGHRIGLINHVFAPDDLLAETEKILRKMMTRAPLALKFGLEAANRGIEMPLSEGLNLEATLFGLLASTEDMKEGLGAFLAKRKPDFKGR